MPRETNSGRWLHVARVRGAFEAAFFRRLVGSESEEDRRAHFYLAAVAFVSPLGELDLCDEFGADVVDAT